MLSMSKALQGGLLQWQILFILKIPSPLWLGHKKCKNLKLLYYDYDSSLNTELIVQTVWCMYMYMALLQGSGISK